MPNRTAGRDLELVHVDADLHEEHIPPAEPGTARLIYIDLDDDLPVLLDRVEDAATPAIVVLPEGARAVHGTVAARLLMRRATAAGIHVVVVTPDRTVIAQLHNVGIPSFLTVAQARKSLRTGVDDTSTESQGLRAEPHRAMLHEPDTGRDHLREIPLPGPQDGRDQHRSGAFDETPLVDASQPPDDDQVARAGEQGHEESAALAPSPHLPALPPQRRMEMQPRMPAATKRKRRWPYVASALALLLGAAAACWILLFPVATITIMVVEQPVSVLYHVALGRASARVPVYHTGLTQAISTVVPGTGTVQVPGDRASGTVTFANPLNGVVYVAAGTVLDTRSGTHFATIADLQVPGAVNSFSGTTNGQASVGVRAVVGGTSSNVEAGMVSTIEGRLAGALLVTNYGAITGGTDKSLLTVTAGDTAAPLASLRQTLAAREAGSLRRSYARSPLRRLHAPSQVGSTVTKFTRQGKPYARVSLTLRTEMDYTHADDVQAAGARLLTATLARERRTVVQGTLQVNVVDGATIASGNIPVRVQAKTHTLVDTSRLADLLQGKMLRDARRTLDAAGAKAGWRAAISIDPSWGNRMPITTRLIRVILAR